MRVYNKVFLSMSAITIAVGAYGIGPAPNFFIRLYFAAILAVGVYGFHLALESKEEEELQNVAV